jgi:trigger factor
VYKQITGMSDEDLRENYRETAQKRVRRSLVFTEIVETEGVGITNEEIDAKIEELARQYTSDESQLQSLRDTFRSPNFLSSIVNRLGEEKTFARIAAIGRGEAPELTAPATTEGKEAESEPVESTDADSTENTEASGEENA